MRLGWRGEGNYLGDATMLVMSRHLDWSLWIEVVIFASQRISSVVWTHGPNIASLVFWTCHRRMTLTLKITNLHHVREPKTSTFWLSWISLELQSTPDCDSSQCANAIANSTFFVFWSVTPHTFVFLVTRSHQVELVNTSLHPKCVF